MKTTTKPKPQITSFDRGTCRLVSARVEAALAPLAEELGIQITAKSGTYSAGSYTFKIECATVGADGVIHTKDAEAFKLYASSYGLSADDLGATFGRANTTYKIVGCKPRSRKYPILCETPEGKTYKLPADTVALHLKASKAAK